MKTVHAKGMNQGVVKYRYFSTPWPEYYEHVTMYICVTLSLEIKRLWEKIACSHRFSQAHDLRINFIFYHGLIIKPEVNSLAMVSSPKIECCVGANRPTHNCRTNSYPDGKDDTVCCPSRPQP